MLTIAALSNKRWYFNILNIYSFHFSITALSTESTEHLAKADWLVGMICAIASVLVIAILVCIVKRNRGGKYDVREKENAQGRGHENDHEGFDEYTKP